MSRWNRSAAKRNWSLKPTGAELARYGLNVAQVMDIVSTAVGGEAVSEVLEGQRRFDVYLRMAKIVSQRSLRPSAISGFRGMTDLRVPLSQVARIFVLSRDRRPLAAKMLSGASSSRPTSVTATWVASSRRRKACRGGYGSNCRPAISSPGAASSKTSSGRNGRSPSSFPVCLGLIFLSALHVVQFDRERGPDHAERAVLSDWRNLRARSSPASI